MPGDIQAALIRCKDGDASAFKIIMDAFQRRVLAIAYAIVGNSEEAMEVMQETFCRVYVNLHRVRNEAGFARFVCKIATNYSIDIRRRRKQRQISLDDEEELPQSVLVELSSSISGPDRAIERKELWKAMREAIDSLPPKQRATLVLHDVDGLSKAEVANIMQCPQGTVRSNLHIARRKLQGLLKEYL